MMAGFLRIGEVDILLIVENGKCSCFGPGCLCDGIYRMSTLRLLLVPKLMLLFAAAAAAARLYQLVRTRRGLLHSNLPHTCQVVRIVRNLHGFSLILQFYNSLCRNLPRRYVLPLEVDEQTPLDQNLIMLENCKATAKKTKPGEVYVTHEELHSDELLQYGGLEFPQINYLQHNGRPYRYFYSCGFGHVFADSLLKMDVHTKELKVWRYPGLYPSEPVFVASSNATEEDDGVVLSVVITPRKEKSTFLLVLDAKTFTELGRAEVAVSIPAGTHGVFNEMG